MSHFKVFGANYKLRTTDLNGIESHGMCCTDKKMIIINKDEKGDELVKTLMHELVHAIWHETGLNQTSIHQDVQEIIAENVSNCFFQNFDIKLKK